VIPGVGSLPARVAAKAHVFAWYRRVRKSRRSLSDPAGQLDVGLKASGVQARVKIAILDRPTGVEDVSVVQTDAMARADPGRQLAQALRLLELAGAHRPAPPVSIARTAASAPAPTRGRREPVHQSAQAHALATRRKRPTS